MSNDLHKILNTKPKEDLKIVITVYYEEINNNSKKYNYITDYFIILYNVIEYVNKIRVANIHNNTYKWKIYGISSLDIPINMTNYYLPKEMEKMLLSMGKPIKVEYEYIN